LGRLGGSRGDWPIVSQHPNVANPTLKKFAHANYLPELIEAWKHIERTSGFRWKSTSYWRKSPSHSKGYALDIAPDIAPSATRHYAVTKMSDPVLYKREKLIRQLQDAAATWKGDDRYTVGVFVEPDHLHIHLLKPDGQGGDMKIVKWKVPKPTYGDTLERMKLPLITRGM
jgi:hypothetical protein